MDTENIWREAARIIAKELLNAGHSDSLSIISKVFTHLDNPELRQGILDALSEQSKQLNIDQLWATWADTRHPELEVFLLNLGVPAASPLLLSVISRLKIGRLDELANMGLERIHPLLEAGRDHDPIIAENANWALSHLQEPSTREEICRWVIEHNHPVARRIALTANYFPKDPHQRALFFLLTEQWERYEGLDFDFSLLSAVFQAASPELRRKISDFARRSGWSGYVEAITHSRQARRLDSLNDDEWEAILAILSRERRGEEMWRLAQSAPVERSAQILRELDDLGWQPEQLDENVEMETWVQIAQQCLQLGAPVFRLPIEKTSWDAHAKPVTCLCMRPQGDLLASGSADHQVHIWQTKDGVLAQRLQSHTAYIQSLASSPDGSYLASGSADRSVRLWRFESGELMHTLGGNAGEIGSLVFSPDSRLIASGDANQLRIWNTLTGDLVGQYPFTDGPVRQIAFAPNHEFIAASGQSSLYVVNIEERIVRTFPERVQAWQMLDARQYGFDEILVITSSTYKKIRLWGIPSGQQVLALDGLADGENLCASPKGQFIFASERNKLRRWNLPDGEPAPDLEGHSGRIISILCDPKGTSLLSAGEEGFIRLWHLQQERNHLIMEATHSLLPHLELDQTGLKIAFAEHNRITIQNLVDLERFFRQPIESITSEVLNQAEAVMKSIPETQVEASWMNLIRLGVNRLNRYDIEISEALPAIAVGSYDIQLG